MNIVLTSHGTLCDSMLATFKKMVASDCSITAVALGDDGVDSFRRRLTSTVEQQIEQGPTLILADLLGGTPYNESFALYLTYPEKIRVVSGFNFGMLIEVGVVSGTSNDLDAAVELALQAGVNGIKAAELPDESDALSEDDLF